MDWREVLKHLRFIDIKPDIKIEQAGIINVKVENTYINLHFSDSEAVKKFQEANITPESEDKIKKDAEKLLAPLGNVLNALPEASMKEVVISTSIATAIEAVSATETISFKIK